MDGVAGDQSSSRLPCRKGFGGVEKRAITYGIASLHKIFDKYVEIIKTWCNIEKRQISDVAAA